MYAVKCCKERSIPYKIIEYLLTSLLKTNSRCLSMVQFSASYSQIALTNLYNYVTDSEIIIFSGHNPDFDSYIGIGGRRFS